MVTSHQLSLTYHWLIHWLIIDSSTNFWKNTRLIIDLTHTHHRRITNLHRLNIDSSPTHQRLITDFYWLIIDSFRLITDSTSIFIEVKWMRVNNLWKGRKRCELRCWVTLVPLNIKMLYYYTHGSWLTNKHTIERTSGQVWVYKSQICVIMITITTNSNY